MEVLPVINCPDEVCAKERVATVRGFLPRGALLHIDVADGIFTFHRTWNDTDGWRALDLPYSLEVHLMVEHPETWIAPWIAAGAKRFIVHVEAIDEDSLRDIAERCRAAGVELMLSSDPETPPEDLTPYLRVVSHFQILCVNPGLAGQKFLPLALEKIGWLKTAVPHAIIEVDGGITPETAGWARDAGADIVVSASYIFNSADPKKAYEALKEV
jgi:ribulose-phosphate 3-epimerase